MRTCIGVGKSLLMHDDACIRWQACKYIHNLSTRHWPLYLSAAKASRQGSACLQKNSAPVVGTSVHRIKIFRSKSWLFIRKGPPSWNYPAGNARTPQMSQLTTMDTTSKTMLCRSMGCNGFAEHTFAFRHQLHPTANSMLSMDTRPSPHLKFNSTSQPKLPANNRSPVHKDQSVAIT